MSKNVQELGSLQKLRSNSHASNVSTSKHTGKDKGFRVASNKQKDENIADFIKKNRMKIEEMKKANSRLRDEIDTEKKIAEKNNKVTSDKIEEL